MKVRSVKALYPSYRHVAPSWRTDLWQIVVRVEADNGLVGFGFGGGGKASLPIVNGHFNELLTGTQVNSPVDIAAEWDRLYFESIPYGRKGVAMMALSGVDLALWDLLGKAENKPVAALISTQVKDSVPCYGTGPDASLHAELGFSGTKTPSRWTGDQSAADELAAWAEQARGLMGARGRLMVDAYMSWDARIAVMMAERLAPYKIHWFEDLLTPDDLHAQSELRQGLGEIDLAGGEHEFSHHGFEAIAAAGALDIWQPDITWCGGITAGIRIAALAKGCGTLVVPHRGGEVWGLHLISATGCEDFAEVVTGPIGSTNDDVWIGEPPPEGGRIGISDRPGFGVEPNDSLI